MKGRRALSDHESHHRLGRHRIGRGGGTRPFRFSGVFRPISSRQSGKHVWAQCVRAQRAMQRLRDHTRMAEQDPINLAITVDAPRSEDDLVLYWVRTMSRWMSDAELGADTEVVGRSIDRDHDADTAA